MTSAGKAYESASKEMTTPFASIYLCARGAAETLFDCQSACAQRIPENKAGVQYESTVGFDMHYVKGLVC